MFLVLAVASVPFSYDGSLRAGQTLTVRDVNGAVRVRAGDRLSIRATKHARSGDPNAVANPRRAARRRNVVCVRYPPDAERGCDERRSSHGSSDNDTAVDFDITLPRGARLDAATVNGTVDAEDRRPGRRGDGQRRRPRRRARRPQRAHRERLAPPAGAQRRPRRARRQDGERLDRRPAPARCRRHLRRQDAHRRHQRRSITATARDTAPAQAPTACSATARAASTAKR